LPSSTFSDNERWAGNKSDTSCTKMTSMGGLTLLLQPRYGRGHISLAIQALCQLNRRFLSFADITNLPANQTATWLSITLISPRRYVSSSKDSIEVHEPVRMDGIKVR
jgi:hypothetical protein